MTSAMRISCGLRKCSPLPKILVIQPASWGLCCINLKKLSLSWPVSKEGMINSMLLISRHKAKVCKGRSSIILASSSTCPKMSCYRYVCTWIHTAWRVYRWPVPKWPKFTSPNLSLSTLRIFAWTCSKNSNQNYQTHADSSRCVITFSGRAINSGPTPVMQSHTNYDTMYGRNKSHLRRWPQPTFNHLEAIKIYTSSSLACISMGYTPANTSIARKSRRIC